MNKVSTATVPGCRNRQKYKLDNVRLTLIQILLEAFDFQMFFQRPDLNHCYIIIVRLIRYESDTLNMKLFKVSETHIRTLLHT